MTNRTTKTDVKYWFDRLCKALGKSTETWKPDETGLHHSIPGAWRLDDNRIYSGYVVEEICNEVGGVSQPLGYRRMHAREFVQAVQFALNILEIATKA